MTGKAWLSVGSRSYYAHKIQCRSVDRGTWECGGAHKLVHQLSFLVEQLGVCKG